MVTEAAIELTRVSKQFGTRWAVDELDLTVPRGSLYGFIGPNGSGKTTTIRMILRVLLPTAGQVKVLGAEQATAADDRTGYLPEERGLYRRMSVRDVLRFFARLKGMKQPDTAVDRWLDRLGLRDRAAERVQNLSKGLAQKVQFAVAVVHDPVLVILDEPFSGLDPVSSDTLRETILELKRKGTTIVLSTHDMSTAERLCDAVMMMHQGKKVLDGSVDEVKARGAQETVRVVFEGEAPSLAGLPQVDEIRDYGREKGLMLKPGQDPQALLIELARRGSLSKFEVSRPSLHEIFVNIAGDPAVAQAGAGHGGSDA
jgi:ABC-2 type transport system ATP-binding protein